jgi:hypothetical protein
MGCVCLSDFSASGLAFSWRVLSVYAFEEMEATDVHGTSVVLLGGDEWKTDRRLSIQPRALLFRRGEFRRLANLSKPERGNVLP